MATKKENKQGSAIIKKAAQPIPAVTEVGTEQIPTNEMQAGSIPISAIDTGESTAANAEQIESATPAPILSIASASAINTAVVSATTGDPEGYTPSPEYRGLTAVQIAGMQPGVETSTAATEQKQGKTDPYEMLAKQYAKYYPNNDTFHITSDKQVFLKCDRNLAVLHQSALKTSEKIHSIIVKL